MKTSMTTRAAAAALRRSGDDDLAERLERGDDPRYIRAIFLERKHFADRWEPANRADEALTAAGNVLADAELAAASLHVERLLLAHRSVEAVSAAGTPAGFSMRAYHCRGGCGAVVHAASPTICSTCVEWALEQLLREHRAALPSVYAGHPSRPEGFTRGEASRWGSGMQCALRGRVECYRTALGSAAGGGETED